MRILSDTGQGRAGFTLIELLAVIAIIGILASIVVPNVTRYIARAQVTKAVSEIKNADTALAGMLSDTGRSSFKDFLLNDPTQPDVGLRLLDQHHQAIVDATGLAATADALLTALGFYNTMFYELLRQGRDSDWVKLNISPEVRGKLGTSYMDLGNDSWDNRYEFWLGNIPRGLDLNILRSYRIDPDALNSPTDAEFEEEDAYRWDAGTRSDAQAELPGQPAADDEDYLEPAPDGLGINAFGYPAPKDLAVYIFSQGANLVIDAILPIQMVQSEEFPEFYGGGDDPNNWDNASGWEDAPR